MNDNISSTIEHKTNADGQKDGFETTGSSPPDSEKVTLVPERPESDEQKSDDKNTAKKSKKKSIDGEDDEEKTPDRLAQRVLNEIHQRNGRILRLDGDLYVVQERPDGSEFRYALRPGNLDLDRVLHGVTGLTHSQQKAKFVIDRLRLLGASDAEKVNYGYFALYLQNEPKISTTPTVITSTGTAVLRIRSGKVERVGFSSQGRYYVEPVGLPWKYSKLDSDYKKYTATMFLRLFSDYQQRLSEGRVGLALALALLPFIRERLDMRPIFQFAGAQGSGKSYTADRFGRLLYGKPSLESATQAALRRSVEPLVLLDDIERPPQWLRDHLRRSSTGTRHRTVGRAETGFEVEDSGPVNSIYVLTAIRIPTDPPLLSRTWLFNFDKNYGHPEFPGEDTVKTEIDLLRASFLSLLLDVLASALQIEQEDGLPVLTEYGRLPNERTSMAQKFVLLFLRAFDRVAPGIIEPENEFQGFLAALRAQEESTLGQTTIELTLLAEVIEGILCERPGILGQPTGSPIVRDDDSVEVSSERLSLLLLDAARRYGVRLKFDMNAVNTGKWIASEVASSTEFTVEAGSRGSGNSKRKVWRIKLKGQDADDPAQDLTQP